MSIKHLSSKAGATVLLYRGCRAAGSELTGQMLRKEKEKEGKKSRNDEGSPNDHETTFGNRFEAKLGLNVLHKAVNDGLLADGQSNTSTQRGLK